MTERNDEVERLRATVARLTACLEHLGFYDVEHLTVEEIDRRAQRDRLEQADADLRSREDDAS